MYREKTGGQFHLAKFAKRYQEASVIPRKTKAQVGRSWKKSREAVLRKSRRAKAAA